MPWGNAPDTDPADAVRSLVGDKDAAAPLLTDDEYTKFLADAHGNVRRAAHAAALALAGQYARRVDISNANQRKSNSQIAKSYNDLAASLLSSVSGDSTATQLVAPMAGGIYDPSSGDEIAPFFTRTYP
jgi:hypothetical protein